MSGRGVARPGSVDEVIRSGRAPDASLIADLTDVVQLGADGAATEGRRLSDQVVGLGPLTPWVARPDVTDVLVNGDGRVWVDRGEGLEDTGMAMDAAGARALAVRLAGLSRRRLDDAQPWVDGVLPGRVRLHAVLPPVAEAGTHLSLRVPRRQPVGVDGLRDLGAVGDEMAEVLRRVVAARLSFLVVGGTGAGKTTVLGALLAECGPRERLVVVEDVRELAPHHAHVVRLQGRTPNVEGAGAVTMVDLVRQALRMRPDRLVVGEVRGAEVRELLAALNTGHDGGAGTLHANGIDETPARLEALGALAGLGREAVHAQLRGAVQVVLDVARSGPTRYVRAVGVTRWAGSEVVVDEAKVVGDGLATRPDGSPGDAGVDLDDVRTGPGDARLDDLLRRRGVGAEQRGGPPEPVLPAAGCPSSLA
ncbi:TadA family conjugal transfer-associated ATPase [Knoellia sp. CPCC 206435]|uniref:TadA family conjugal transfer-associated ATPase n=1 Tax=Knoellia terrae TaxID=3404797 RepID=UPI003B42CAA4